jgi:hypothetical protein
VRECSHGDRSRAGEGAPAVSPGSWLAAEHRLQRVDPVDRLEWLDPVDRVERVDLVDRIGGLCRVGILGVFGRERLLGLVRGLLAVGPRIQAVRVWLAASRPSSLTEVSRILNFCTLPVTVMGNASVTRT